MNAEKQQHDPTYAHVVRPVAWKYAKAFGVELEDLVQRGHQEVVRAMRRYNPSKGKPETYLWPILHLTLLKEARRMQAAPVSASRAFLADCIPRRLDLVESRDDDGEECATQWNAAWMPEPEHPEPESLLDRSRAIKRLQEIVLSHPEGKLAWECLFGEGNFEEKASEHGITPGKVARLRRETRDAIASDRTLRELMR